VNQAAEPIRCGFLCDADHSGAQECHEKIADFVIRRAFCPSSEWSSTFEPQDDCERSADQHRIEPSGQRCGQVVFMVCAG
jgi:hypothetical protein